MAAVGRWAAVCATAEHVPLAAEGTDAVHGRRGISVASAPRIVGEAFDGDHRDSARELAERGSVVSLVRAHTEIRSPRLKELP